MAPTIVDMAAELEASPRIHTIEAVTVELADVTIDAAIDAAMFEPPLAHTVAHALNPHLAHTVAPLCGSSSDTGPQRRQARHDAFHMQLMAGLMNRSWV